MTGIAHKKLWKINPLIVVTMSVITLITIVVLGYLHLQRVERDYGIGSTSIIPTATYKETTEWHTYLNTEYGYRFNYPSNWSASESLGGASIIVVKSYFYQDVVDEYPQVRFGHDPDDAVSIKIHALEKPAEEDLIEWIYALNPYDYGVTEEDRHLIVKWLDSRYTAYQYLPYATNLAVWIENPLRRDEVLYIFANGDTTKMSTLVPLILGSIEFVNE